MLIHVMESDLACEAALFPSLKFALRSLFACETDSSSVSMSPDGEAAVDVIPFLLSHWPTACTLSCEGETRRST